MKVGKVLALCGVYALACWAGAPVYAGEVEIVMAKFEKQGPTWTVNITLRHADKGWDHYADMWRIVGADGKEYSTTTLWHPHESEQPFTRSQSGITLPPGVTVVYVEAHDKVHGWSKQRVKVELTKKTGDRYQLLP